MRDVLIILGAVLSLYGTVGLIKAKNNVQRLHFLGVSDTIGAALMMIGVMLSWTEQIPRISLVLLVSLITGPLVTHVVAKMYVRRKR
ncbi:MAG: monovalent cation/H(+) antiporter subunit G [Pseudothermotoga sp.]|uniref:cation:proton antiporter n=1 Tax=Pseudothermotoga sp. TaxID=2033661 RepID=UPI00258E24AB|nr:monovalent cation/H(+) antiporter subunit G [Pseudothermotoga sp.]MDI6862567.1 monovalent cation/H(+) antiporter subunit G [Pseudothermotoga sp.]